MSTNRWSRREFLKKGGTGLAGGYAAWLLAACATPAQQTATTAAAGGEGMTQLHFILDWIPKGQTSPFYLALDKGFWAERGLAVSVSRGYGSGDTSVRVGRGEGDFGWAGVAAVMNTISQGVPLLEIAATAHTHPTSVYAAPGIEVNEPRDLVGLRGAVDANDENDNLFKAFAAQEGLDYSNDIDWIYVDGAGVTQVEAGQADFVMDWITNLPEWWLLDPPIEPGTLWIGRFLDIYGNGVITRPEVLERDPDAARRFAEGAIQGYQYVIEGGSSAHEESIDALFKFNPELEEQPNAREFHLNNLKLFLSLMLTGETQEHGIGYFLPEKVDRSLGFINQYLLEEPLERDQAFRLDLLESGQFMISNFEEARSAVSEVMGRSNPLLGA